MTDPSSSSSSLSYSSSLLRRGSTSSSIQEVSSKDNHNHGIDNPIIPPIETTTLRPIRNITAPSIQHPSSSHNHNRNSNTGSSRSSISLFLTKTLPFQLLPPTPPPNIHIFPLLLKLSLSTILTLYILNQKHLLPKPLSSIVSKTLFWPTLPISLMKRIGNWSNTIIDDTVIMGGAPFAFMNIPQRLYDEPYHVRGIINLCEEYDGPKRQYERLGIEELKIPTTDHFEPELEDIMKAVEFIQSYKDSNDEYDEEYGSDHAVVSAVDDDDDDDNDSSSHSEDSFYEEKKETDSLLHHHQHHQNSNNRQYNQQQYNTCNPQIQKDEHHPKQQRRRGRVYVHCRAGHGRSAAIVYAWLLSQEEHFDLQTGTVEDMKRLNEKLRSLRNVRKTLWKQPNINKFRRWLMVGSHGRNGKHERDNDD